MLTWPFLLPVGARKNDFFINFSLVWVFRVMNDKGPAKPVRILSRLV